MHYPNTVTGTFISRPNRFIAHVDIDGIDTVCHVKNTGRCKELLIPGAKVILQKAENPERKTPYDLITVQKGDRLINMDSQSPNKLFAEWAKNGGIPGLTLLKGEQKYGDSRLDFYLEIEGKPAYAEVKGVTLEEAGIVRFPDAPTERGVKHIRELIRAKQEGYGAFLVFIVQMDQVKYLEPNRITHPEFAVAMADAEKAGVTILAVTCEVTEDTVIANERIPVKI